MFRNCFLFDRSPFTVTWCRATVVSTKLGNRWALTILKENPEIPGEIHLQRFIAVEIFSGKSSTFRGITFFPFLPKRPKFSVPFVWITSARLQVERKRKNLPVFCKWYSQSRSCFRSPKKIPAIFDGKFSPKFPYKMVSARDFVSKFNLGKNRRQHSVILLKNDRSKLLVCHVLKRVCTLNRCTQRPNVSKYARRVLNSFLCALEACCLANLELP